MTAPRLCACGCGTELPRKGTKRRFASRACQTRGAPRTWRVLALDLGAQTGCAVIDGGDQEPTLLWKSETWDLETGGLPALLGEVQRAILWSEPPISVVVYEKVRCGKKAISINIALGQAKRAGVVEAAIPLGVKLDKLLPTEWKQEVCVSGAADKLAVREAVQQRFPTVAGASEHAIDAIALGWAWIEREKGKRSDA